MKRKKGKAKKHENRATNLVKGTISASSSGYAFLSVSAGEKDYLIPAQFLGNAIDRDLVEAELMPDRRSDGHIARVVRVLERRRKKICGVLLTGGLLKPLSRKIATEFRLKTPPPDSLKGHWVEMEFDSDGGQSPKILNHIGPAGDIQSDILAIKSEYNLPNEYSEADEKFANKIEPLNVPREHFDFLPVITIDPADAKDYDDAISVRILDNKNYQLGVHIADVACFVPRGSKFDGMAYERAFTSYLPGRTLPMLPKSLTRKISLNPSGKSLAHSILMEIDKDSGRILSSRRFHSIINVTARLSFDDLEFFIENKRLTESLSGSGFASSLHESLSATIALYRLMRQKRQDEEEFLDIETELVRALCDEGGNEVKILKRERQRDAEKLVEEFMLAANVEAAKELLEKSIPGLFRIHPAPLPQKSAEFADFIKTICGFYPGDISSRKSCLRFLSNLPDDHRKPVLTEAFLRAMARAYYSEDCGPHFGLGKTRYAHFTSPIRRYPDLIVHQQLLMTDLHACKGKKRDKKELASIAAECSQKEALNDEAFWAANDLLKLHYLKRLISKEGNDYLDAVISKINKNSMLINIPELGIRGEIPFELLPIAKIIQKRKKTEIREGKRRYKPGDFIAVSLASVDIIKGRAIFKPL